MPLTSRMLADRFALQGTELHRWTEYGWIEPEQPPRLRGQGSRLTWPRWVARMVALLTLPGEARNRRHLGDRRVHEVYSDRLRHLADALVDYPDALWFAWVDGTGMVACATDEEAVRVILDTPGPLRTLVGPPTGEGIDR